MQNESSPEVGSCPVHLIADQVAEEDVFGHREVAGAIAEMVIHEDRGCAIALTGTWGSGKSTVVGLLKAELERRDADVGTFVFDAWAHQGDPLRRTFLEKLIDYCIERRGWIRNKKHWQDVIEELAKRKETTETKSSPNLTLLGAVGAITLLLAPAALQFYAKNEFQYHLWLMRISLFLGGLPALLALCASIFWVIKRRSKSNQAHPLASLFYSSSAIETSTTSSKTIDPTSVEFEKRYRELLSEALGDSKRKILIVVDNLDRVNHDDARSIWAAMRVFFDVSASSEAEWNKRVWVLVPFDPNAIEYLWEVNGETADGNQLPHHFLEKAFQATFRVPPVILSDRREYLVSQLRVAFPNHTETEFHNIFRLYDRLATQGKEPPTPRNIKIFVNKLGSLHRQWQHRIPFTQQAAFVLWAERNESVLAALPMSGVPVLLPSLPATISALLDEGWPRNFVALYFNVDPKDAYQVLLSGAIREAIQARDKSKLGELEQIQGFPEVMESTIEDLCGASTAVDTATVADAAVALSGLKGGWQGYENCRAHLCRIALSFEKWEPFDAEIAVGIKSLVQTMPASSGISPLVRAVANSLRTLAPTNWELSVKSWCAGLAVLIPVLEARDKTALKKDFRVVAGPEQFLDALKETEKGPQAQSIVKYLMPSNGLGPVFEYLAKRALGGNWDEYSVTAVQTMHEIDSESAPNKLFNAFRPRINTNHLTLQPDIPKILETALYLSGYWTEAEDFLNTAAKGDSLFQILGLLPADSEYEATAACILPLLGNAIQVQPGYPPHPNTTQWSSTQGKQRALALIQAPKANQSLMQVLSRDCLGFHVAAQWREICEKRPEQLPLISEFLRDRLSGEDARDLDIAEVVEHADFWRSVIPQEDFAVALDIKAKTGELSAALIERPFDLGRLDLYLVALAHESGTAYRGFLSKALDDLTEEEWEGALRDETDLIEIAIQLNSGGLVLGQPFQDALIEHAEWLFSQNDFGRLAERWAAVPTLLQDEGQAVLSQRLWNSFSSESGDIAGVIPYYGELLSATVNEFGPELASRRIVEIINHHNEAEIKWLAATLSKWVPHAKGAKASQSDWRKRVERLLGDESTTLTEDERSALNALRDALSQKSRSSKSSG